MANRLEIDLGTRLAEEYLMNAIARWADHTGNRVLLAFDGHPKTSPTSPSERVRMMRPGDVAGARTADDVLLEMIKESHGAQNSVLVTNDVELQRAARSVGVRTIVDSNEFLDMIKSVDMEGDEGAMRRATTDELAAWEQEFGVAGRIEGRLPTRSSAELPPKSADDAWQSYLADKNVKPLRRK